MKLDISNKPILSSPFRFLDDLKNYYDAFYREYGIPETIIMNSDQKIWFLESVKESEFVKKNSYKNIIIE